jgi:endoglucanase
MAAFHFQRRFEWMRKILWMITGMFFMVSSAVAEPVIPTWTQLWCGFQSHFIDRQGRIIDPDEGGVSTSEGQSYALFFALVANNKALFQKIMTWTQDNMAQGNMAQHLPIWRWGKTPQGHWGPLSGESASDADLWLAYTLLQAGHLWHSAYYIQIGQGMLRLIVQKEVVDAPGWGPFLLPGPSPYWTAGGYFITNPSYAPLFILRYLADADPQGPWRAMAQHLPDLLEDISPHGYVPDWIAYRPSVGWEMAPEGPLGSFNAIRCYLWASMASEKSHASSRMLRALRGMIAYLKTHTYPPEYINTLSGQAQGVGPVGFSAALLPYLKVTNEKALLTTQYQRLQKAWEPAVQGYSFHYYDNALALFSLGFMDHLYGFTPNGTLWVFWEH